jgi:hypothetical protein
LAEWNVDLIYSVCFEFADQFYKRASRHARIERGLTGFVDDADIPLALRYGKPFKTRDIDVGYRAKTLPAYFGRFGRMKSEIGTNFIAAMGGRGLRLDISVRDGDVFEGDAWLRFLGNCRFTIGCESGSSLLDPQGDIRSCVEAVVRQHPRATFEDIEQRCFVGLDMKHVYSAISPRLFEAALARSCQLLVPGRYMGVLQPDVHYIPIAQDLSNAEEVYEKMQDDAGNQSRIEACYSALVEDDRFRYRSFVANLLGKAVSIGESKGLHLKVSSEDLVPSELDEEVRHEFMVAVVRSHHHHLEDMKEAKFIPNFLHMIAVFFARKLLSFGQRFR